MIKLDDNYSVRVDSTHGFQLRYQSDPKIKVVKGKSKEVVSKDTWYFPKLSMVLKKYYAIKIDSSVNEELLDKTIQLEKNISNFSKTFAKQGKVFEL